MDTESDQSDTDETTTDDTSDGGSPDLDNEVSKWKSLARKHEAQAKANATAAKRLAEIEDGNKSEIERATTQVVEAEKRAGAAEAKALRLEAALEKAPDGMSIAQIRKLANRLQGDNAEELAADAEELFAEFTPPAAASDTDSSASRRPKERLRSGAAPDADQVDNGPAQEFAKFINGQLKG